MPTLLPRAYSSIFFGMSGLVVWWAINGAAISMFIITLALIITVTSGEVVTLDTLRSYGMATLTQIPMFRFLEYYAWLWVVTLAVVGIGTFIYVHALGQAEEGEYPVDYYANVVTPIVVWLGRGILLWLLGGSFYLLTHYSQIMGPVWSNITQVGVEGLKQLGATGPYTATDTTFDKIYPYIPAPMYLLAYVLMLRNAHTGWVGNVWTEME